MTKLKLIIGCLVLCVLASCAGRPEAGTAALVLDTKEGVAFDNSYNGMKMGKACSVSILGIAAVGDSSVEEAMRNGGIKTVSHMDKDIFAWNIYLSYGKACTIVYGY